MANSRPTGDPSRPHDRLATLYGRAYEALEQLQEEVETLIAAGEMDGPAAEGLDAAEWAARFDELGGMARDLAVKTDEACDRPGGAVPRAAPAAWRERLLRSRQASARRPGGEPSDPGGGR